MKYLLGVDFGGSSSKATLLGEDGRVYATASREYPTYYPQNGWAEQDPDDSYQALVGNIREILRVSGAAPEDILVVEDALHCIEMAKSCGFCVAAVYDPCIPDAEWARACEIADLHGTDLSFLL